MSCDVVDEVYWGVDGWSRTVVSCSVIFFFFSSRRRHTRSDRDWSSDVCSSDLGGGDDDPHRQDREQQQQGGAVHNGTSSIDGRSERSYAWGGNVQGELPRSYPGEIGRASCRERV